MINDHGGVADNLKRQWSGGLFWFQRLPAIACIRQPKSKLFLIVWQIFMADQLSRNQLAMRSCNSQETNLSRDQLNFFNGLFHGTRESWGKHQKVLKRFWTMNNCIPQISMAVTVFLSTNLYLPNDAYNYNKHCCVLQHSVQPLQSSLKHTEEERQCFTNGTNIIWFVKENKVWSFLKRLRTNESQHCLSDLRLDNTASVIPRCHKNQYHKLGKCIPIQYFIHKKIELI